MPFGHRRGEAEILEGRQGEGADELPPGVHHACERCDEHPDRREDDRDQHDPEANVVDRLGETPGWACWRRSTRRRRGTASRGGSSASSGPVPSPRRKGLSSAAFRPAPGAECAGRLRSGPRWPGEAACPSCRPRPCSPKRWPLPRDPGPALPSRSWSGPMARGPWRGSSPRRVITVTRIRSIFQRYIICPREEPHQRQHDDSEGDVGGGPRGWPRGCRRRRRPGASGRRR